MLTLRELALAAAIVAILTAFVIDEQILQAMRELAGEFRQLFFR
jgi:hypothetical protein